MVFPVETNFEWLFQFEPILSDFWSRNQFWVTFPVEINLECLFQLKSIMSCLLQLCNQFYVKFTLTIKYYYHFNLNSVFELWGTNFLQRFPRHLSNAYTFLIRSGIFLLVFAVFLYFSQHKMYLIWTKKNLQYIMLTCYHYPFLWFLISNS